MTGDHWHPWREIRNRQDIDVRFVPDGPTITRWTGSTVHMDIRLARLQSTRRCLAAHELVHAERQVSHANAALRAREERTVDAIAARRLIPLARLADALAWTSNLHEAAEELWVHPHVLSVRLATLTATERAALTERTNHE